jgi:pilus assembly protein Flp/PilA
MYLRDLLEQFAKQEDGLALSEYLVLLGLIMGGVVSAVFVLGSNLGILWGGWALWITSAISAA